MPAVKVLARDYIFEINTGTDAAPTWVRIKGINTFSFDPSKTDADTTDFDNQGWGTHLVASRAIAMNLAGQRLEDPANGDRDPGQQAVEELADNIGPSSLAMFRFYYVLSRKGKSFTASCNVTGPGGGNNDPAGWSVDLTISGAPANVTVPAT